MDEMALTRGLLALKETINSEVGTEPDCPFCGVPRVRRTDYIRCNPCGTNWLDVERHLREYLSRNPSVCRDEDRRVRMASITSRSAVTSKGAADDRPS
jgi:hypothetical protein